MKFYSFFLGLVFISCGNDFRPKEEEIYPSLSDTIRPRTGDGIYPDTTQEDFDGGFTRYIYHDAHLRETQIYEGELMTMQYFLLDGKDDSVTTSWHKNGVIQVQAHHKNGKHHGWTRSWNSDGTLHEESYYEFDTLIKGTQIYMDENFLVDYIEIIEDGKVVRIDSSLRGTETSILTDLPK